MGRRAANTEALPAPAPKKRGRGLDQLRIVVKICGVVLAAVGCIWAAVRVEQLVITDRQFLLEGPPEPGVPSASFTVEGVVNASERRIIDVFMRDFGRSVYLCPIEERRRRLLAIDWVREARVSRIWPNRLVVRITERVPVAFVQISGPSGGTYYGLIDEDGVMLDPQHVEKLALPVLAGFSPEDSEWRRKERVKRFLRLQSELGQLMDKISEIDIADLENLKLTQQFEDRALTLMVGNQKFLQRYRNFLDNYTEIRKRLPHATVLDLRLRDRITAAGSDADGSAAGPVAGPREPAKESAR